jgi:hypothetical protein
MLFCTGSARRTARNAAAALALASGFAAPASADDWTGGFAGISAGQSWVTERSPAVSIAPPTFAPIVDSTYRGDGRTLGVVGGYRLATGPLVLGGEVDADWADARAALNSPAASLSGRIAWQGSARVTAGVKADRVLLFVTGGPGLARTRYTANFGLGAPLFRWSRTATGWVAGGGVELDAGRIHPRLEYRHADYRATETAIGGSALFRRNLSSDSLRLSALIAF